MSLHLRLAFLISVAASVELGFAEMDTGVANPPVPLQKSECLSVEALADQPSAPVRRRAIVPNTLRVYRLAVAASGEFTQFHGGTVASAQKAISDIVERVNAIYEPELGIRLVLITNNSLLVYTDPATDPYTANNSSQTTIIENQRNIDQVIGSQNYDIAIMFNTGRFGLSYIRSVCLPGYKASATVGDPAPVGEDFVRLVAHEIGHQFGANHTFNSAAGECGRFRHAETAFEPGSGSTLMAYASWVNCGTDNLQPANDLYFHTKSIEEILSYITDGDGRHCTELIRVENRSPAVEAGTSFAIPNRTPFMLTATASDADNDPLTFCWEQYDLGPDQSLAGDDTGTGPIFRSYPPTHQSFRIFPRLIDVLSRTQTPGERLPVRDRTLTFRVTVRDGKTSGVAWDTAQVTVHASAGPFEVLSPTPGSRLAGAQQVTWSVSGTDQSPINAASARILLSTDGGNTFPFTLADNTPNDGVEVVMLPDVSTSQARIKVEALGHVFFNISPGDFIIEPSSTTGPRIEITRSGPTSALVSWPSVQGRVYRLQARATTSETWNDFGDAIVATESRTTHPISFESAPRRFYRVVLLP